MKTMPKNAVSFAIKHGISLGRDIETGYFYIADPTSRFLWRHRQIADLSLKPTGRSAIMMMKRYLLSK